MHILNIVDPVRLQWKFDSVLAELIDKGEDIVDYLNICHVPHNIISRVYIDNKEYKSAAISRYNFWEWNSNDKDIDCCTFEFTHLEGSRPRLTDDSTTKRVPAPKLSAIPYARCQEAYFELKERREFHPVKESKPRWAYDDFDKYTGEMYFVKTEEECFTDKVYHHLVTLDLKRLVRDWGKKSSYNTRYADTIIKALDGIVPAPSSQAKKVDIEVHKIYDKSINNCINWEIHHGGDAREVLARFASGKYNPIESIVIYYCLLDHKKNVIKDDRGGEHMACVELKNCGGDDFSCKLNTVFRMGLCANDSPFFQEYEEKVTYHNRKPVTEIRVRVNTELLLYQWYDADDNYWDRE